MFLLYHIGDPSERLREYRVSLSIDGVKTPVEIYNCRDQFKITKNQRIISFDEDNTGELICNLVD